MVGSRISTAGVGLGATAMTRASGVVGVGQAEEEVEARVEEMPVVVNLARR